MLDGALASLTYNLGMPWETAYRRILKGCWLLAELSRQAPAAGWPTTPRDVLELALRAREETRPGGLSGLDRRALWQLVRDPEVLLEVLEDDPAFLHSATAVRLKPDSRALSSDDLHQHTFPEAKALGIALSDGPSGRWWSVAEIGSALIHSIPHGPLHTRLDPLVSPMVWQGRAAPATAEELMQWIRRAGQDAVLLVQIILGYALASPKQAVEIDTLVNALFDCRSTAERNEKRQWVWDMVSLVSSMVTVGRRQGKWRDRYTKEILDTYIEEPLLNVMNIRRAVQPSLYPNEVPISVGFDGGAWIEAFRHNASVLSYFGNIIQIAGIPGRKPSAAWARVIALNLNQWWREHAMVAELRSDVMIGWNHRPDSEQTVGFCVESTRLLTRRLLLCGGSGDGAYYQVSPEWDVLKILGSDRPKRAKDYWTNAIAELTERGIVWYSGELAELPPGRQGWAEAWLDQPLDIRPAGEGTRNMAAIMRRRSVPGAKAEEEAG